MPCSGRGEGGQGGGEGQGYSRRAPWGGEHAPGRAGPGRAGSGLEEVLLENVAAHGGHGVGRRRRRLGKVLPPRLALLLPPRAQPAGSRRRLGVLARAPSSNTRPPSSNPPSARVEKWRGERGERGGTWSPARMPAATLEVASSAPSRHAWPMSICPPPGPSVSHILRRTTISSAVRRHRQTCGWGENAGGGGLGATHQVARGRAGRLAGQGHGCGGRDGQGLAGGRVDDGGEDRVHHVDRAVGLRLPARPRSNIRPRTGCHPAQGDVTSWWVRAGAHVQ